METCLSIERKLNTVLSTKFRCYWDEHNIEDEVDFQVTRAALGPGVFGRVEGVEDSDSKWVIEIGDNLDDLHTEITLAHELMHVLLYRQGHPAICLSGERGEKTSTFWDGMGMIVHSILSHPIIWPRVERHWGYDLDICLEKQIEEVRSMFDKQTPSGKWDERNACVSFMQNRLDGVASLCDQIERRFPRIASRGEIATKWLLDQGYAEAEKLTANQVIQIGKSLLKLLSVEEYLCVCVTKDRIKWEGV